MDLQKDLKEFLRLLLSKRVEFVVVGGAHAVAFHGHPRLTGDIDILVRATPENAERLETVCCEFGFSGSPFVAGEFLEPGQIFQRGRPPNRIDLLTSISGISTENVWLHRISGDLSGETVFYISKPDLILNKRSTGRLKNLSDVDILSQR